MFGLYLCVSNPQKITVVYFSIVYTYEFLDNSSAEGRCDFVLFVFYSIKLAVIKDYESAFDAVT